MLLLRVSKIFQCENGHLMLLHLKIAQTQHRRTVHDLVVRDALHGRRGIKTVQRQSRTTAQNGFRKRRHRGSLAGLGLLAERRTTIWAHSDLVVVQSMHAR